MKSDQGTDLYVKRTENGFTQAELAEAIGVTQATISNWEHNVSVPTPEQLQALEEALESGFDDPEETYGEWLIETRIKAGLSVAALAEKTGVSIPQIYNIESGRSLNPQITTKDKLEKVLGGQESNDASKTSEQQSTIDGLGALIDFDPHDRESWPVEGGVYVFYDISDRPLYVGQSSSVAKRLRDHEEKFWFKRPVVERGAYIGIEDAAIRIWVEKILIKFLKSNAVLNSRMVER